MPMKLNVGLSQKIGLPDYGSLGVSCAVEVEMEGLVPQDDPEAFRRYVRNAYAACAQAVNEELARHRVEGSTPAAKKPTQSAPPEANHAPSQKALPNGNGNGSQPHPASEKQVEYIHQLARQISGLGVRRLDALATKMFGRAMANLTSFDASGLIDCLKAIKAGEITLASALGGATP